MDVPNPGRTDASLPDRTLEAIGRLPGQVLSIDIARPDGGPVARAPGVALAVRRAGATHVFTAGAAVSGRPAAMPAETRFPIGCLGKILTARLVADLVGNGAFSTKDTVGDLLPELAGCGVGGVAIEHLVDHTSGFREAFGFAARWEFDWDDIVGAFRKAPVVFVPGSVWSYSQTGHVLLQRIVERAAGAPYPVVRDRLVRGILGYAPEQAPDYDRTRATLHLHTAAGLMPIKPPRNRGVLQDTISSFALTVDELCRLYETLVFDPPRTAGDDRGPPSPTTIPFAGGGVCVEHLPDAYQGGFGRYGELCGNNGSYMGATCAVWADVQTRTVAAAGVNAWVPDVRELLVRGALQLVADPEALVRPTESPLPGDHDGFNLSELVGEYRGLMHGCHGATIDADGDCKIRIQGYTADSEITLKGRVSARRGGVTFQTRSGRPLGVFRSRETNEPILRFGLSALDKIS